VPKEWSAAALVELGVEDGEETATVASHTRLPVDTTTASTTGTRTLVGTQTSEVTATYDLDDGGLRRATAITVGRFRLRLGPPEGGAGRPLARLLFDQFTRSVDFSETGRCRPVSELSVSYRYS
jgi:hypothetical protein